MLWTAQKGGSVELQLTAWFVAHGNARVTSNNTPSGILDIGNRRVVIKGEDATNPDTKL